MDGDEILDEAQNSLDDDTLLLASVVQWQGSETTRGLQCGQVLDYLQKRPNMDQHRREHALRECMDRVRVC